MTASGRIPKTTGKIKLRQLQYDVLSIIILIQAATHPKPV
jgi:hypothetical protein